MKRLPLRAALALLALATLTACSMDYHEPAPGQDHPANPHAAAAPLPPRSGTLRLDQDQPPQQPPSIEHRHGATPAPQGKQP